MRESSLTLSKELPCCLNGNLVEGASNKCPLPNCVGSMVPTSFGMCSQSWAIRYKMALNY